MAARAQRGEEDWGVGKQEEEDAKAEEKEEDGEESKRSRRGKSVF